MKFAASAVLRLSKHQGSKLTIENSLVLPPCDKGATPTAGFQQQFLGSLPRDTTRTLEVSYMHSTQIQ
jgi:hypothetical protein